MKKILLALSLTIISVNFSNAQNPNACTIQPSCTPTQGVCSSPAPNAQLPDAEFGTFYSTVIQFSVASNFSGIPINECSLTLLDAPEGMTVVMTPAGSADTTTTILGGENACVTIYGTPVGTAPQGSFIIGTVSLQGTAIMGGVPQTLQFDYSMHIYPPVTTSGINELYTSIFTIAPNPSNGVFQIEVTSPTELIVYSISGQEITNVLVEQVYKLDASSWDNGLYYVVDQSTGNVQKIVKN